MVMVSATGLLSWMLVRDHLAQRILPVLHGARGDVLGGELVGDGEQEAEAEAEGAQDHAVVHGLFLFIVVLFQRQRLALAGASEPRGRVYWSMIGVSEFISSTAKAMPSG